MPTGSVDTQDPGKWWHAPFPFGADRDDVLDSGMLMDGRSSAAGYSRIRQWIINQYFHTLGR